jgi:hypothetical protein
MATLGGDQKKILKLPIKEDLRILLLGHKTFGPQVDPDGSIRWVEWALSSNRRV